MNFKTIMKSNKKTRYYRIVEISSPNSNGTILRLKSGKLEIFEGESTLQQLQANYNPKQEKLSVGSKYQIQEID